MQLTYEQTKQIVKILSEEYNWEFGYVYKEKLCLKCGIYYAESDNFCTKCGEPLTINFADEIEELMEAINKVLSKM